MRLAGGHCPAALALRDHVPLTRSPSEPEPTGAGKDRSALVRRAARPTFSFSP